MTASEFQAVMNRLNLDRAAAAHLFAVSPAAISAWRRSGIQRSPALRLVELLAENPSFIDRILADDPMPARRAAGRPRKITQENADG